ncbi:hypothetical protein [Rubritalea marina]|uniref:hypothetical protein n=1 Tax=Rubritalea marina TaxID=361055 RepID=UPI00038276CF|nr:hypothetical protein [Rubritalea marina]
MSSFTTIACLTCAKAFEHVGKDAAGMAILFMLCIVLPIITTIGVMIFRIARRQKQHFDPQYADTLDS